MPGSKKKRPIIVCDASPLIFWAKLNQLGLIERVTGRGPVVLRCVVDERLEGTGKFQDLQDRLKGDFNRADVPLLAR